MRSLVCVPLLWRMSCGFAFFQKPWSHEDVCRAGSSHKGNSCWNCRNKWCCNYHVAFILPCEFMILFSLFLCLSMLSHITCLISYHDFFYNVLTQFGKQLPHLLFYFIYFIYLLDFFWILLKTSLLNKYVKTSGVGECI